MKGFGVKELLEIKEPMISADNVLKRWPGILESELANMIDRSSDLFECLPIAYHVHKVLDDGQGGIITECIPCGENGNYYVDYQGNDAYYDFTGIAFILSEISKYENDHPKVLYQVVTNPDEAWGSSKQADEYLPIEEVRKSLQLSPYQFVCFLNDDSNPNRLITSWEESFMARLMDGGYRGGNVPFFSTEDLSNADLRVHRLDWEEFQQRGMQEKRNITIKDVPVSTAAVCTPNPEFQLAEAQKQIESLHQWNKRLNDQNQELRTELAAASQPQEVVTVDAALWENSFRAACSVLVKIVGNNETGITRSTLENRMKDVASGGRTHTKADRIAWESLPDKHKSGPGRPKK